MRKPKDKIDIQTTDAPELIWQRASYHLHTFAYRDPRSAFSSGAALPVVSPTTVLLGVVSTLFFLGEADQAKRFLSVAHQCEVLVDAPEGIVFFRAFHQLRRYHTVYKGKDPKKGANPRYGLTTINQGTREYGLIDGLITLYVGAPQEQADSVMKALTNLRHIGTQDSLCALASPVEICSKPKPEEVFYMPSIEVIQELRQQILKIMESGVTMVTLSRFKKGSAIESLLKHWHITGGQDSELLTYAIPGRFQGTTRGKIYKKRK